MRCCVSSQLKHHMVDITVIHDNVMASKPFIAQQETYMYLFQFTCPNCDTMILYYTYVRCLQTMYACCDIVWHGKCNAVIW